MTDFTATVTIAADRAAVFDAILDPRGWWNATIDGPTAELHGEFGFEVQGLHRTRIRVVQTTANRRVEWLVVENYFGFVSDQSEWVGDRIVFELRSVGGGTELVFTQRGLVPEQDCYDVCSNAWGFFLGESLRSLVELGEGKPESAAGEAAPAEKAREAAEALQERESSGSTTASSAVQALRPNSIVLGSTQPARFHEWYLKVLAPQRNVDKPPSESGGGGTIRLEDFILVIEGREDVEAKNPQPGQTIVNFHVDDFDAVESHLRSCGVDWSVPVSDRPSGKFGTFADPDGNLLQIIQFT